MPLNPANLVYETSTSTGTGNLTVAAVNGKQRLSTAFGTGGTDVFDYFISNRATTEWERGTGHMSDANTLVRDTVIESTNANAAVNFSSGTKDVTNAVPAGALMVNQGTQLYFNLSDPAADALFGWDDSVSRYENLTAAEAFAVVKPEADAVYQPLDATLTDLAGQSIAQGTLLYGDAADSFAALAKDANATRYLSNTGASNNPAWAQVNLADGVTGDLPFSNLTQGSALSVLGVTGNSTADNASIAAGTDHQVLRRSGTAVAFGAVNLAQAAAVTGELPGANVAIATTTTRGSVEFATQAEAQLKTSTTLVPTPSALALFSRGLLWGLTLSNNGADATNDIDIAVGVCAADASPFPLMENTTAGLTKRLDASWAVGDGSGGLDTGSIGDDTYHVFLIMRSDTGVVDALFSTSPTAPTMPANYDYKRRIGSIMRVSAAIVGFVQDGDRFDRKVPITDVTATNPGTAAVTRTLSVPTDIVVDAIIVVQNYNGTNNSSVLVTPLDTTDTAATVTLHSVRASSTVVLTAQVWMSCRTNTSAQIRTRNESSGVSDELNINTFGWIDTRGRTN